MSPDRFNSELFLSTSEAAELLGVHPSTVKRWTREPGVSVHHTEGGHRRLHLSDVLELARRRSVETFVDPFGPYQGHVWRAAAAAEDGDFARTRRLALGWLHRGRVEEIGRLFEVLAAREGISLPHLLDDGIQAFMRGVGEEWREGRLRVGDEHRVSQILLETLLRMRAPSEDEETPGRVRPTAVAGSAEGDQHHLGSLGIRLVLERAGWEVIYLGPDVPLEEFADIQARHGAGLVSVSFSAASGEGGLRRAVRVLSRLYEDDRPYRLALGGPFEAPPDLEAEPRPFLDMRVFRDARGFSRWLESASEGAARGAGS